MKVNVKDLAMYIDISGTYTLLSCQDSAEISINREIIETLCKGNSGHKSRDYGSLDATGSVSGTIDDEAPAGTDGWDLAQLVIDGTKGLLRFTIGGSGDKACSFTCVLSSVNLSSQGGGDANAQYSADFASDGAVVISLLA